MQVTTGKNHPISALYRSLGFVLLLIAPLWGSGQSRLVNQAQKEVTEGNLIAAMTKLKKVREDSPESVYLKWKVERRIGKNADPPSRSPDNAHHQYFQYVQQFKDRFSYYEPSGSYRLSEARVELLRERLEKIDEDREYVDNMAFALIKQDVQTAAEGGYYNLTKKEVRSLRKRLTNFINSYPSSEFVTDARELDRTLQKTWKQNFKTPFQESPDSRQSSP